MRTLFLFLFLSLLLRPVLRFTLEGSVRRAMLLLIDGSQSMVTPEKRLEEPDLKRAAIATNALDATKGLAQPFDPALKSKLEPITRLELMKAVLNNPKMDLLNRLSKDYDLRPFTFGSATTEISSAKAPKEQPAAAPTPGTFSAAFTSQLKADAAVTPLGDAIKELLGRSRGQPLAGIFVMTDGQSNSGSPPQAAAELARQTGVPLYIYGVGIAQPKDIAIASIFSPDICFVDDEVPVVVRVRSTNLAGRTGKVALKLGEDVVDTKDVDLVDDGEQVTPMLFTPKKGRHLRPQRLGRTAAGRGQSREQHRQQKDPRHRRQDQSAARRAIPAMGVQVPAGALGARPPDADEHLSRRGRPGAGGAGRTRRTSSRSPVGKANLIDKFDLVILGDIDPRILSAAQLSDLNDFVNKFGGGLIVVPGKRFGPAAWRGTPMEKLLPVEVDTTRQTVRAGSDLSESVDRPIKLEITPAGFDSPMLRLSDKAEESKKIWGNLPPIYWDATVSRAKPGATVFAVDPDPKKVSRTGKMPVIAMQQYGLGQVLYVGTDNTWRWRKNAADKYHATLWGQMVLRLSLPHLLGESKKTQLSADKKKYSTGDKVTVYARLYTETYEPIVEKSVAGSYQASTGRSAVGVNDAATAGAAGPIPRRVHRARSRHVHRVGRSRSEGEADDQRRSAAPGARRNRAERGDVERNRHRHQRRVLP